MAKSIQVEHMECDVTLLEQVFLCYDIDPHSSFSW